ncbi:MAG: DUF4037 domain-containing protein [Treponema sp.]|jgi:hypothetical protein|nr:DUF4037 domain-containing protein [Treponema sp.]
MKIKTKMLVDRFANIISAWPAVECISLNEAALPDTFDPYFALILDVYYEGNIPDSEERFKLYGDDVTGFESSQSRTLGISGGSKDRFLINDLPVRMEYKPLKLIEDRVAIADTKLDSIWLIKDSGTYGFYRLAHGELIFSRSGWIKGIRDRIGNLSDEFWQLMRIAHESKMEHFLSDLGAAAIQQDDFNYLISAAGFIKSACLTLFCINRCFEPSHKAYYKQVTELPRLPDSFKTQFSTFLRCNPEKEMERSFTLAKLIARGIVTL